MSLRALWVSQDFPPDVGGIQTYSAEIVRSLVERGVHVEVIAPRRSGCGAFDRSFPARVHRVLAPRDTTPVSSVARVLATASRRSFDVAVHAQWTTAAGSLLARRAGLVGRVVLAAHGRELLWSPPTRPLAGAYAGLRRRALAQADAVAAVSRYTRDLVLGLGVAPDRAEVVNNGTDVVRLRRPACRDRAASLRDSIGAGHAPLLLTVARLVPNKGIDTVIRALPLVARRIPAATYVVVGSGRDRERLLDLARAHGVADRVHLVGSVRDDDVAGWLHACDAFVLTSRARPPDVEGFGIVLLDAAACGRAVVAGRSGGIPDAVVDGDTGLLCDPERVEDVAAALVGVLGDPQRAAAMGAAGQSRVERDFTWAHVGARFHRLLEHR